jgi:hypothetical protein
MGDQRPPRFASNERETVMELWRYHRESLVRKASGLSDEDARRRLVGSETTLLWLANHVAASQRNWILNRFAGGSDPPLAPSETMEDAIAACRESWRVIDAVIDEHDLDDLCSQTVHGDSDPLNLRWGSCIYSRRRLATLGMPTSSANSLMGRPDDEAPHHPAVTHSARERPCLSSCRRRQNARTSSDALVVTLRRARSYRLLLRASQQRR